MGIIKKFKDYFKTEPVAKSKDVKELNIDDLKQHFQVLTDSATDFKSEITNYILSDGRYIGDRKSSRVYPSLCLHYTFNKDDMSEFDSCLKWANKAADIFESETEFNVVVNTNEIEDWSAGNWEDDDTYTNPDKFISGHTIDIYIINRMIYANNAILSESNKYIKKTISPTNNKQLLKYIEDNLMWDFKDNDITYTLYGLYDGYGEYKGVEVQLYKHENNPFYYDLLSEIDIDYTSNKEPILMKLFNNLGKKINSVIECDSTIDGDTICISMTFSFKDNKLNL